MIYWILASKLFFPCFFSPTDSSNFWRPTRKSPGGNVFMDVFIGEAALHGFEVDPRTGATLDWREGKSYDRDTAGINGLVNGLIKHDKTDI